MKQLIALSFCLFAFAKAYSQDLPQMETAVIDTTEKVQVAPVDTVKEFFAHFNTQNTQAMRKMMSPDLTIHSLIVSESNGKTLSTTKGSDLLVMLDNVTEGQKIEERIIEYESVVSKDHATVSTTYEFYSNGEFTHNGTNIFTLFLIDKAWYIVGIADTRLYP
jgi:hypothetical protein